MEKKPYDTASLKKKYGIFGLSIIQIVGIIFILAMTATVIYHYFY